MVSPNNCVGDTIVYHKDSEIRWFIETKLKDHIQHEKSWFFLKRCCQRLNTARPLHLQCISNGDTMVLHYADTEKNTIAQLSIQVFFRSCLQKFLYNWPTHQDFLRYTYCSIILSDSMTCDGLRQNYGISNMETYWRYDISGLEQLRWNSIA